MFVIMSTNYVVCQHLSVFTQVDGHSDLFFEY